MLLLSGYLQEECLLLQCGALFALLEGHVAGWHLFEFELLGVGHVSGGVLFVILLR